MRNVLHKINLSRGRAMLLAPSRRHVKCETVARSLFFLLALVWCFPARGDIDVKPQYDANEPIVATVTITDVPDGAKLRGSFAVSDGSYLPAGENVYHIWAAPGKHTLKAAGIWVLTEPVVIGDKTIQALVDFGQFSYERTFTVGPEVPVPPPFPPVPPVPPVPGGPYQILLLYDQDQLDNLPSNQRDLLTSLVYRQKLTTAGHRVLGVFAAQTINLGSASKFKAFFDAVKDDPLPRIAITKLGGGKVADFPLPANMADLEKLLATEVIP